MSVLMSVIAASLFLLAGGVQAPAAPPSPLEQELIALDKRVDEAQRNRDVVFFGSVLTDDFLRVSPAGVVQTKADILQAMSAQAGTPAPPLPTDIPQATYTIRVSGETAVMTHAVPARVTGPASAVMHVFVRQQGQWRMSGWANVTGRSNVEQHLNEAGYTLLADGKAQDAIEIFRTNVRLNPQSWNVYDSLGEALAAAGQTAEAIENYAKSVEINPQNEAGRAALAKLRGR